MFINYDKLAEKIVRLMDNNENESKIMDIVVNKIANQVLSSFRHYSYYENQIQERVVNKVVNKLYNDFLELHRAQILEEYKTEDLSDLLSKKIKEQAKEHVKNFTNTKYRGDYE